MSILSTLFAPAVPTLKPAEVHEKLKNGKRPFVLDVREKQELREGYISGAKLIPLGHQLQVKELKALSRAWAQKPKAKGCRPCACV
jgi:rhodanese-related sulfurtransferase